MRVADGDRLNRDWPFEYPGLGHGKQGALEGHDTEPPRARAFGKKDEALTAAHAACQTIALNQRITPVATDEHRTADLGNDTEERPTGHLGFGNEGRLGERIQVRDVEIGDMICHL